MKSEECTNTKAWLSDLLHIPPAWPSAHRTPQRQNSWALRGPSHWGTQNCCSSGGNSDRVMMKRIQMSERHAACVRLLTSEAGVMKVETLGWPLGTSIITKPSDTTARAHSPSSSSSARLHGPLHTQTHTLQRSCGFWLWRFLKMTASCSDPQAP